MSATSNGAKAASRKRGAAAAAEKTQSGPKKIEFRDIELELPGVLPGTLYFDFADISDDEGDPAAQIRLLRSLLGDEQVRQIRQKVADDGVTFEEIGDVLGELFEAIFSAYGSTVGESEASPTS